MISDLALGFFITAFFASLIAIFAFSSIGFAQDNQTGNNGQNPSTQIEPEGKRKCQRKETGMVVCGKRFINGLGLVKHMHPAFWGHITVPYLAY